MYVMWYGLGRFFIEGLRTDSLMIGPFRISQVVAAASTLAALALWLVLRRKYAGVPLMVTYTAVEKGKDGPVAYSVSWPAAQKAPSAAQLKERLAAARAQMQQAGADEDGHVPPEPKPAAQKRSGRRRRKPGCGPGRGGRQTKPPGETARAEAEAGPAEEQPGRETAQTGESPAAAQSEAAPEAQTKAGGPAEATHPDQRDEHTPKP